MSKLIKEREKTMSVFDTDMTKIAKFAKIKVQHGINEMPRMDIHQLLKKNVEAYSAWLKDVLGETGYRQVGKQIIFDARMIAQLA